MNNEITCKIEKSIQGEAKMPHFPKSPEIKSDLEPHDSVDQSVSPKPQNVAHLYPILNLDGSVSYILVTKNQDTGEQLIVNVGLGPKLDNNGL